MYLREYKNLNKNHEKWRRNQKFMEVEILDGENKRECEECKKKKTKLLRSRCLPMKKRG